MKKFENFTYDARSEETDEMRNKVTTAEDAVNAVFDGATVMVGGFMACGTPELLIDALVKKDAKNLTVICNDAGLPGRGVGKLLSNGQIKTLIASHVGLNPEVMSRVYAENPDERLECVLIPQATFVEKIRAGGSGLGGFLSPTELLPEAEHGTHGTFASDYDYTSDADAASAGGKRIINAGGKDYLLEEPLRAEFALVHASVADTFGNTAYNEATQNFNPLMATAADTVIVSACQIVELGELDPNIVKTSGSLIDYVVGGEEPWQI